MNLVKFLLKCVSDTLWIGMMNYLPKNVNGQYKLRGRSLTANEISKVEELRAFYSLEDIKKMILQLYDEPKIRWKESIKKMMINHIKNTRK